MQANVVFEILLSILRQISHLALEDDFSRWCSRNKDIHGANWNRDVNASANMLTLVHHLLLHKQRPESLSRPPKQQRG